MNGTSSRKPLLIVWGQNSGVGPLGPERPVSLCTCRLHCILIACLVSAPYQLCSFRPHLGPLSAPSGHIRAQPGSGTWQELSKFLFNVWKSHHAQDWALADIGKGVVNSIVVL